MKSDSTVKAYPPSVRSVSNALKMLWNLSEPKLQADDCMGGFISSRGIGQYSGLHSLHSKSTLLFINIKGFRRTTNKHRHVEAQLF